MDDYDDLPEVEGSHEDFAEAIAEWLADRMDGGRIELEWQRETTVLGGRTTVVAYDTMLGTSRLRLSRIVAPTADEWDIAGVVLFEIIAADDSSVASAQASSHREQTAVTQLWEAVEQAHEVASRPARQDVVQQLRHLA